MKFPFMPFLHRISSPPRFYRMACRWIPRLGWTGLIFMLVGLVWGLGFAPPDYQQGNAFRIMYIHVPSAWLSLFIYTVMAVSAVIAFVWRIKLAEVMIIANAPIGATFTFLALVTGSIWGKPMWGTYWVWDPRLTFELILLFQYFGVIALYTAITDRRVGARAAAILAMVGIVTVPIVHYSVVWWSSLHQGSSFKTLDNPAIAWSMLVPLLIMFIGTNLFYLAVVFLRSRNELLLREKQTAWVGEILDKGV
ncbi:MAG: heme ABC transporter permease [Gammaproteobacteria bacterium]|jgi:heme exporter protein C